MFVDSDIQMRTLVYLLDAFFLVFANRCCSDVTRMQLNVVLTSLQPQCFEVVAVYVKMSYWYHSSEVITTTNGYCRTLN